jgi:molybdenum cofactor cytidylyltransferase
LKDLGYLINKPAIAGIIIAAGESRRLNSPKQLLDWQGEYLINHIIHVVQAADIQEILVVLGSHADVILPILEAESVKVVENSLWSNGMSTSIKKGIEALSEDIEGAFILLVDQPFVNAELLNGMIEQFSQTSADIIAPRVGERQCNPVLFRKTLFSELLKINGDKGAKALLKKHPVEWIAWHDPKLMLDIDSAEDYQIALKKNNY